MVKKVYTLTSKFPPEERYNLISQLRRAAVSIPCNISEGAARNTKKHFVHYLYISSGSSSEVETLLSISRELGILSEDEIKDAAQLNDRVSALIQGLITQLEKQFVS